MPVFFSEQCVESVLDSTDFKEKGLIALPCRCQLFQLWAVMKLFIKDDIINEFSWYTSFFFLEFLVHCISLTMLDWDANTCSATAEVVDVKPWGGGGVCNCKTKTPDCVLINTADYRINSKFEPLNADANNVINREDYFEFSGYNSPFSPLFGDIVQSSLWDSLEEE